jgi:hypothetical protein
MSRFALPNSGKIWPMKHLGDEPMTYLWTKRTCKIAPKAHHKLLAHRDEDSGEAVSPNHDPV